jgi:hypothetical protein
MVDAIQIAQVGCAIGNDLVARNQTVRRILNIQVVMVVIGAGCAGTDVIGDQVTIAGAAV